jgi:hypothetical protein
MLKIIPKNSPFLFSLFIVLPNYLLLLLLFHSRLHYDDWQILQYVSGTLISDEPAEFLIYMHTWVGLLISSLYRYIPHIPWYGIYLHFILFVSAWLMLSAILRKAYSIERVLIFLIFFYVVLSKTFLELRYSSVSAYATMSGFFLLFSTLVSPSKKVLGLSVLMLLVGFLIRKESGFLLVCATLAPVSIWLVYIYRKQLIIKHLIFYLCTVLLFVWIASVFESEYYSYHEQSQRLAMNKKMNWFYNEGMLHYNQYPHAYQKVGLTKTDYFFGLYLYNYFDQEIFTEEKIDVLLSHNDIFTWKFIKMRGIEECYHTIVHIIFTTFSDFYILVLLGLGIGLQKISFHKSISLLLTFLNINLGLILLYFFLHISYAPHIMYASWFLLLVYQVDRKIVKREHLLIFYIFCGIFGLLALYALSKLSTQNKKRNEQLHYFLSQLKDSTLHILWDSNDSINGFGSFDDIKQYQRKNVVMINYYTDAPTVIKKLKRFKITNINKDMINHESVLFAPAKGNSPHYITYMKNHYGYDLKLIENQTLNDVTFYEVRQ